MRLNMFKESIRLAMVNIDRTVGTSTEACRTPVHTTPLPHGHVTKVKLPKITINMFSGDLT